MSAPQFYSQNLTVPVFTASAGDDGVHVVGGLNFADYINGYWVSGAETNGQYLQIDLGSAQAISGVAIVGMVMASLLHPADAPVLQCDAGDDPTFPNPVNASTFASSPAPQFRPFSALTKRYWRLKFNATVSLTAPPHLGQIILCNVFTPAHAYDMPNSVADPAYTTAEMVAASGMLKASQSYGGRNKFAIGFSGFTETDAAALRAQIETVRGKLWPFWFIDGGGNPWYVKWEADYMPLTKVAYSVNDIKSLKLQEFYGTL